MKSLMLASVLVVLVVCAVLGAGGSRAVAALGCSSATTQMAINACESAAAKAADATLTRAFTAAMRALPQARRASLSAAQSAWRQYRSKECTFEAGAYAGGSLMPSAADACYANVTATRSAQLKALLAQLNAE